MKITGIETYPVWAGARNLLFVVVTTDEGVSGLGESGLTGRELAVEGTLRHLESVVIDQDPFRTEYLWQVMFRGGFFPARHVVSAAISALDIALWDIKGKVLGVPVYELLGGRARDKVVCYPHNSGHNEDVDALVESCRASIAEGWKFVRWDLPYGDGNGFDQRRAVRAGIDQLRAVRSALPVEIELCFDVHTRLDLADAVELCREVESVRPYFIEDPLRSEHLEAYGSLRPRTTVPIAAGEQLSSKWEFQRLIEQEWIDFARVDLCIVGGLTEAKKVAAYAEAHHIRLATHNPLGPVSTAACLHLNLSVPNMGVQEQPQRPGTALADVITGQPDWEDGYLLAPGRPGLGIELNREAARARPFQPQDMPQLRHMDGAVTNW